jgi:hypothetical protein
MQTMRRPGGNWSISRIDEAEHFQTVLYEIDMLRFAYSRIVQPPEGAREADVWAYLESFLLHYRNLLEFFGKSRARDTDLTIQRPEAIWSAQAGVPDGPAKEVLEKMRALGNKLWEKYEDSDRRDDTISRYLQHCTTYRVSPKAWFPAEMMSEISELLALFDKHLPKFQPATHSRQVDRAHFLGGESVSTHSGSTS